MIKFPGWQQGWLAKIGPFMLEELGAHKGYDLDLTRAQWRKSSRSGGNTDMCVEVAFVEGVIAVRDSKNTSGPVLVFDRSQWDAFVEGAKDGEFDS